MAQIIVNPKEMVAFAAQLDQLTAEVRNRETALDRALESLNVSWNDERYRAFGRAQETASLQLKIFYNRSGSYTNYLRSKAAAARRYLGH